MSAALSNDAATQLKTLYAEMEPRSLFPLWEVLGALVTPQPRSPAQVHRWRYAEAREYLLRAGDLISAAQAERRVLIMENPGLPGSSSATSSLYAGLQLILPGEIARCHRHSQCALRFVMEGDGAFTAVDGEKAVMHPFDLVLTPGWQWHDHGNTSGEPMIWLDGLDVPTVLHFDASFAEHLPAPAHPETVHSGDTALRYGRNMRPMRGTVSDRRPQRQPLFHYPYREWRDSLEKPCQGQRTGPAFRTRAGIHQPGRRRLGDADDLRACALAAVGFQIARARIDRRHGLCCGGRSRHGAGGRQGNRAGGA